jgi:ubiquinone/menaquinone biosynthesis C-methylase UbiE
MPETQTNDEQIAYWNEKAGPKWVAFQDRLDAQLEIFTRTMLDRARLIAGERVLDIGCGCGATTLDAAARVSPGGSVTGVDISRPMLERARQRAKRNGVDNVTFLEADAQIFVFAPPAFDAAISRFGVMFFIDPVAAFTNIRRALKSGGRLCFICWRPMVENPWVTIPMKAAAQHIEMPPPPEPHAPGPFAFADAARLRGILESAGFAGVQIDKHDSRMPIGSAGTLDDAVEFTLTIGPVSALLMDKPDALRNAVRNSIRAALKPHHTPNGVVLDSAAWLVSATSGQ